MRAIVFAFLSTLASYALAQPMDATASRILFTFKQEGVPISGSFRQFSANIDFHRSQPQFAKADLTIQTASLSLPTTEAVQQAQSAAWFAAAQYPTAHFVSTAVAPAGDGHYVVTGKLTLKGITHDITAPFNARIDGADTVVDGVLPISRLAFHVGEGDWSDTSTVADQVQVRFHLVLKGT